MIWFNIFVVVFIVLFVVSTIRESITQTYYDDEALLFLKDIFEDLGLNASEIHLRDTTRLEDYLESEYFLKHTTLNGFDVNSEKDEIARKIIMRLDAMYDIKEYFVVFRWTKISSLIENISQLLYAHKAEFKYYKKDVDKVKELELKNED